MLMRHLTIASELITILVLYYLDDHLLAICFFQLLVTNCSVVRHIALDSLDSSLAIGFYCRDKSKQVLYCMPCETSCIILPPPPS